MKQRPVPYTEQVFFILYIGEVFARLIEDTYSENNVFIGLREVYKSWLAEKLMNYNSDLYYQSRDYLAECYRQGRMIAA